MNRIGIDLGGTKIEGVVLAPNGTELHRERVATERERGYEAIVDRIVELIQLLEERTGTRCRVGLGHPGSETPRERRLKNSNTTCMNGQPLRSDLEARLGRPIRMANDANCFALSEAIDGSGAGARVVFGVILGTGVGGGVVLDRRVHRGPNDVGGEWGHTTLDPHGPACYCGHRGCVETILSGPAFAAEYRSEWNDSGENSPLTAEDIVAAATRGEKAAISALDRYCERLARALAGVVNVLDPDVIVLGGGLSKIERLYRDLPELMAEAIFNDEFRTPIRQNVHGDSSGVRGAAFLWAPEEHESL
ncbi:MAG: ROK family protein [Planctomycetota bacterium]